MAGNSEQLSKYSTRPGCGRVREGNGARLVGHTDKLACFAHCSRRLAHFLPVSPLSIPFVSAANKGHDGGEQVPNCTAPGHRLWSADTASGMLRAFVVNKQSIPCYIVLHDNHTVKLFAISPILANILDHDSRRLLRPRSCTGVEI